MSTMVLARPSGKMEPPPTEMGRLQMEQVLEREEGGLGSGDQELSSKFQSVVKQRLCHYLTHSLFCFCRHHCILHFSWKSYYADFVVTLEGSPAIIQFCSLQLDGSTSSHSQVKHVPLLQKGKMCSLSLAPLIRFHLHPS